MLCDVQWLQGSYCTVYCTAGGAASFTSSLQKLSLCGLSHPHIAQSMIPWCPRLCLVAESITWAAMEVCQHQPFSPECKQTNKANIICSTCQKRAPSIDEKSIKIQAVGQSTLCRSSCLSHRNTALKKNLLFSSKLLVVQPHKILFDTSSLERRKILPETGDDSMTAFSSLLLKTTGVCPCTCLALKTKVYCRCDKVHPILILLFLVIFFLPILLFYGADICQREGSEGLNYGNT